MLNRYWPLALLIMVAGASAAQPRMYKSVGADGKVVYTDRPPIESATETRVMHGAVLRPVAGLSAVNDRQGYLAHAGTGALSRPVTLLEATMVRVMARQRIPAILTQLCPHDNGAEASTAAARGWGERNRPALAQKNRLLREYVQHERRVEMQALILELERAERNRLAALAPGRLVQWCHATTAALDNGELDIVEPTLKASRSLYEHIR